MHVRLPVLRMGHVPIIPRTGVMEFGMIFRITLMFGIFPICPSESPLMDQDIKYVPGAARSLACSQPPLHAETPDRAPLSNQPASMRRVKNIPLVQTELRERHKCVLSHQLKGPMRRYCFSCLSPLLFWRGRRYSFRDWEALPTPHRDVFTL
jgi:hypothetical protein